MPPQPHWYAGRAAVAEFASSVPLKLCPSWRHRTISANGQPAVALYLGEHTGAEHVAWSINVLTMRGGKVAGIVSFLDTADAADKGLFEAFGLPRVM